MSNSSTILSANGGLHSKRAMRKVKVRLANHGMKRAILVHFVITGSQSVQVYRDTYNDIADHIRDNGSRTEYFGCLEMDESKGLHAHVYFVIETSKKFPHKTLDVKDGAWLHKLAERRGINRIHIAKPKNKMHHSSGKEQFFARLDDEAKLADCLERVEYLYKSRSKENVPCREIYFNSNFEANRAKRVAKMNNRSSAALPAAKEEAPTVADIQLHPIESITVKESKNEKRNPPSYRINHYEGEAGTGCSEARYSVSSTPALVSPRPNGSGPTEAYSSSGEASSIGYEDGSRISSHRSREVSDETKTSDCSSAALQAAKEQTVIDNYDKTQGNRMTPAEQYLARKYEEAVDQQLDVGAIRLFLLSHGIPRTPAQVEHELEHTFGFYGYAASHPAPPRLTYAEFDAQLGGIEKPSRVDRAFPLPAGRLPMGRRQRNTNMQGTI